MDLVREPLVVFHPLVSVCRPRSDSVRVIFRLPTVLVPRGSRSDLSRPEVDPVPTEGSLILFK